MVRGVRRGEHPRLVVVEGARLASEAVQRGATLRLVLVSPRLKTRPMPREAISALAGHPLAERVPDEELARLSAGPSHQGVLIVLELPDFRPQDCLAGDGWLVALDRVQDAMNLGAIARAALAFGASGIWYQEGGARPDSARAYRASAGALLDLPVVGQANLEEELAGLSWPIYVASAHGAPIGRDWPPHGRAVLVLGNEGQGSAISRGRAVTIPTSPRSESLNVAQAGAILLQMVYGRDKIPPISP